MNNLQAKIWIDDNHKIGQESKNILNQFILQAPKGWYSINIKRQFKKATKNQFGYLYAFVYDEFLKAIIQTGEFDVSDIKDLDDIDDICKGLFLTKSLINRNSGEMIPIPKKKRNFNTLDQMIYTDAIRDYAAEKMNYFIPDPDPNWRETKAKLLQEKEFILKAIKDCVSIEELDNLFPKAYELGLEIEFENKEIELQNLINC